MKNTLKIDFDHNLIVMDRTFAKKAENTNSDEYAHLQTVRKDYPSFKVIQRTIKSNPNKKTYPGLTYEYMEDYILNHGSDDEIKSNFSEYRELRTIAKPQRTGVSYPVIKKWFLKRYPEFEEFGKDA